ncbi:MAG: TIGR00180 family glycosyltransferase [Armatimonadetes bacterium]|nr:TIGR00180 family glycosyltransferase [Armatimonadota bacterium]
MTLLVPTRNRPGFVTRLLHYYAGLGFRGHIAVGDSSDPEPAEQTRAAVAMLRDRLNLSYREYPGNNNAKVMQDLLQWVSTPYAALLPDDDFLVPRGLDRCAEFLERNPAYSAAHGLGVTFVLEPDGPHGRLRHVGRYWQRPVEGSSGAQRLLDHLGNYSVTLFSVHRTEDMRLMYREVTAVHDVAFATELLPCCLSVIRGRIGELDCLYLARQIHAEQYRHLDLFDWIASPQWHTSYAVFRDRLAEALAQQDGIGIEEAQETVKQAVWSYLARMLTAKWQARYAPPPGQPIARLRGVLRRIPAMRAAWHSLRALVAGSGAEVSLETLLRPSSRYHADFLPICRAAAVPPESSSWSAA